MHSFFLGKLYNISEQVVVERLLCLVELMQPTTFEK